MRHEIKKISSKYTLAFQCSKRKSKLKICEWFETSQTQQVISTNDITLRTVVGKVVIQITLLTFPLQLYGQKLLKCLVSSNHTQPSLFHASLLQIVPKISELSLLAPQLLLFSMKTCFLVFYFSSYFFPKHQLNDLIHGVLNINEHYCDYINTFSLSQVTRIYIYSKGIVILVTTEDEEIGLGKR